MFLKNFQNLEFPGILPVPGNTRKESGYLFPQLKNNFPELTLKFPGIYLDFPELKKATYIQCLLDARKSSQFAQHNLNKCLL